MLKIHNIILLICLLISPVYGETLDSGKPVNRIYKIEEVSSYLGKRILVTFIDENIENQIILNVTGILVSRWDNEDFLLLGKTEYKNRITIPIEKIQLIERINR